MTNGKKRKEKCERREHGSGQWEDGGDREERLLCPHFLLAPSSF